MLEPEGELRAGNAVLNIAFTAGVAVGPAVAGGVVAAFGVQSALLLDAASFYVIGWILLTAKPLPQPEPEPEASLRERVQAGLGYIRRNPTLRLLLATEAVALIFFSSVEPDRGDLRQLDPRAWETSATAFCSPVWGVGLMLGSIVFASAAARLAPASSS